MNIKILPSKLTGTVNAPPSKSDAHRAIIAAALCKGVSTIKNVAMSDDIKATLSAVAAMGANVKMDGNTLTISGGSFNKACIIDCNESGSTLRFMLPIVASVGIEAEFRGSGKLPQRTYKELARSLTLRGTAFSTTEGLPTVVSGKLEGGLFEILGDISSQFISGLLFALPVLDKPSQIIIRGKKESAAYIDMTIATLRAFGITIKTTENGYYIEGGQSYKPTDYTVEGDWSNSAFWLAAGCLGGDVTVTGLNCDSPQGDKNLLEILAAIGAEITINDGICVKNAKNAFLLDASQIPDLAPILCVIAANCEGESVITNAERLRFKESDRIQSTAALLRGFGLQCTELPDGIKVLGGKFKGGIIDGSGDHRIVMSAAIAAAFSEKGAIITGADAVRKSYPDFFEKFLTLGGKVHELNVGRQD